MRYCRNCKVNYQTPLERCLFCNNELVDTGSSGGKKDGKLIWEGILWPEGVELKPGFHYPVVTRTNHGFLMFRRMLFFLLVLANTICLYINYINRDPNDTLYGMGWSFMVLGISIYLTGMLDIAGRNLMGRIKVIWYGLTTVAEIVWIGVCVGRYQWALDYLLPFGLILVEFYATVLLIGGKRKVYDAAIYVLWLSLLGMLPILLKKLGLTVSSWASVTCGFYSGITLFGLFFFGRKTFLEELRRRFYL